MSEFFINSKNLYKILEVVNSVLSTQVAFILPLNMDFRHEHLAVTYYVAAKMHNSYSERKRDNNLDIKFILKNYTP